MPRYTVLVEMKIHEHADTEASALTARGPAGGAPIVSTTSFQSVSEERGEDAGPALLAAMTKVGKFIASQTPGITVVGEDKPAEGSGN